MDIQIYHSSSAGNLYRVSDSRTALLIEAGVPVRKIKQALNFHLSEISACLISHEHKDHARAARDLPKAGIDCYMSWGTQAALDLSGHRYHVIEAKKQFRIGTWSILPFRTVHDATEPLGFLLRSGNDKLLYATDTLFIPSRFQGLTHIMIECDYEVTLMLQNIKDGIVDIELGKKVLMSHMSLETVKEFFHMTDKSKIREIYLLHLSKNNSDADLFRNEIQRITGKPVYIGE